MANLSKTTKDHEEIRRWAEERGGKPSHVKGTGSSEDIGILRIDFPGYSGQGSLEAITWEEWFDKFDERKLALLYQEETAEGQHSNFNKIVSAGTAREAESRARRGTRDRRSGSRAKKAPRKKTAARKGAKRSASSRKKAGRSTAKRRSSSRSSQSRRSGAKRSAARRARSTSSASRSGRSRSSSSRSSRKRSAGKKTSTRSRR